MTDTIETGQRIRPVIMVGGSGTRLWPLSRKAEPKQFKRLITERSMFQETLARVSGAEGAVSFAPPIIVGSTTYEDLIKAQLSEAGVRSAILLLEPCPRNTTPVAAVASQLLLDLGEKDTQILLLPSDHHIEQQDTFRKAVADAALSNPGDKIITFGIHPTRPATGYGYIRRGEQIGTNMSRVLHFAEKPAREVAENYLSMGDYTWNSGMFLFSPEPMLAEMSRLAEDTLEKSLKALRTANVSDTTYVLNEDYFSQCDNVSIDYAVMEKTDKMAVFGPLDCGWSDVGNWRSVSEHAPKEISDDVISIDNEGCFFRTDGSTMIAAVGLKDMIVVAHNGAILVMPANRAEDVSSVVAKLKEIDRKDKL